jgi:hypothetical protein
MKRTLLIAIALVASFSAMAQTTLSFPFQGGKAIMDRFFKDSVTVTPQIIAKKASGLAVFKFSADEQGTIKKIIIYYADDLLLTEPVIKALQKSNHKWIIPDHEKVHDFILPFVINFSKPATESGALHTAVYNFNRNKKPVVATDQVPLDMATLLPAITINYEIK